MAETQQREILRRQVVEAQRRHAIAEVLKERDIPLEEIQFEPETTKVIHIPTQEYFVFGRGHLADNPIIAASCTRPLQGGESTFASHNTFGEVMSGFENWCILLHQYLATIAKYHGVPDPFSAGVQAFTATEFVAATAGFDNRAFTALELTAIQAQLGTLKQYVIQNGDVQGNKLAILEGKIDYLVDASNRLGKKDWLNILIATLIGIVIAGIFAPDRAHELMDYGASLFAFLFQQPNLLN